MNCAICRKPEEQHLNATMKVDDSSTELVMREEDINRLFDVRELNSLECIKETIQNQLPRTFAGFIQNGILKVNTAMNDF